MNERAPRDRATEHREADAVARVRQGSAAALAQVYDWHNRRVRQLARRMLGDDLAAEDLVQEIFERLPAALGRFRDQASLETLLFSMVVNCARAHVRRAVRRRRALQRLAAEPLPLGATPDASIRARELAAALVAALDRLPMAQRVAFVLCQIQELTSSEAAAVAGVPEATMRTRLFHARRQLRLLLPREAGP